MSRFMLALRIFFRVLGSADVARRVAEVLSPGGRPPETVKPAVPAKPKAARSEAISLLATLQREARLVDLIMEPLGNYSDAQIGAAARDVLRDCKTVLERVLAIEPLNDGEGSTIEVPVGYDAAVQHITGNVSGQPPFRGRVVHHGWRAKQCQLPVWTGSSESAMIVAPAEIEVA